ncbi:Multidrug efflux pump subunit AcrA (membrane-fusion protein) [Micromonospora citrea]|uniref:Multidrug efflux pump subunit AcrA (Membrane-fusion protein) n=1 Tax=Micromonospora citrea TaxID=47855 RepID=A0A1C6V1J2_9ACTN|nr:peptidoglycan-binding protein [Micromonospora citrea]SCL60037.1 Multidrug efflux pump subunit AcrA (membrane-fusion protein) [Micromonospora citrea]
MSEPMEPTEMSRRRPRRRLRAAAGAGLVLATLALAGAATLGLGGRGDTPPPARTKPSATAPITRQTLVRSVALAGELGYGTATPLASLAAGTVTWLPETGATVRRGEALLRADEQPVVLLYGALPMYRPLATDVRGSDVRQFERNLAALGYRGFTVDDTFSASTADAVRRWQKDLGTPETGTVDRERVIYAPGALRVSRRLVPVGASATSTVLAYTGSTRVVTVSAGAGEATWAKRGTKVSVTLPTGVSVAGKVTTVAAPAAPQNGQGPADSERPGTGSATVEVTIAVADQRALGGLSDAPVDVRYVAQQREQVLTVPVDALLALAEGGYGVEVTGPDGTRVLPVRAGLFAEGRVEVQGDGLAEGLLVGVPG